MTPELARVVVYRGWEIAEFAVQPDNQLCVHYRLIAKCTTQSLPRLEVFASWVPRIDSDARIAAKKENAWQSIRGLIDQWHIDGSMPPLRPFSFGDE